MSSSQLTIQVITDAMPFLEAIASLEQILERSPEAVQRFLSVIDPAVELCHVNSGDGIATGACELVLTLEPSKRLRDFIAAALAGDFNSVPI